MPDSRYFEVNRNWHTIRNLLCTCYWQRFCNDWSLTFVADYNLN